MKQIQWYPGHMAKAINEIKNQINAVDILIEIIDARCPISSRNPEIINLETKKPSIIIMSKSDLADNNITSHWQKYFKNNGQNVIAADISKISYFQVKEACMDALKEKRERDLKRGLRPRPIRALVVGIPNVGKSTFINKIAKRKATITGDKPGVTKSQQYIKIDNDFIMLDSPGILWPNFEDKKVGINLALIGSIKQDILPKEFLCEELIKILTNKNKNVLSERFNIEEIECNTNEECSVMLGRICDSRHFILPNNERDINRTIDHLLKEFSSGKIGKISLEDC